MCAKAYLISSELNILQTCNRQPTKVLDLNFAHINYWFTCICGVAYVGRTDWCLGQRTGEQCTIEKWNKWLIQKASTRNSLVNRKTSHDLRSSNWPRPSIPSDSTEPQPETVGVLWSLIDQQTGATTMWIKSVDPQYVPSLALANWLSLNICLRCLRCLFFYCCFLSSF